MPSTILQEYNKIKAEHISCYKITLIYLEKKLKIGNPDIAKLHVINF